MTESSKGFTSETIGEIVSDLGHDDLQVVLSKLATARETYADPDVGNSKIMRVSEIGLIEKTLRQAIEECYQSLAFCELDVDGMLRKRIDLVRAFGFPYFETFEYTRFPVAIYSGTLLDAWNEFHRESGAGGPDRTSPDRKSIDVMNMTAYSLKSRLLAVLPRDLGRSDIVKFVTAKNRLDEWFEGLASLTGNNRKVVIPGVALFFRVAERIRNDDPMTAPGSEFGEQLERIRRAAEQIDGARDAAQAAAGQTADAALSTHFAADASSDGKTAAGLSIGSLVSLVAAFWVGLTVIGDLENVGLATELAKLALTLPLLAISAYLGRLSTHYRESARWAKTAAVQLKTIDAFTHGVAEVANRDEMKLMLGKRIFSDPEFGNDGKNPDVEDLVALVEAIGNAVKTKE